MLVLEVQVLRKPQKLQSFLKMVIKEDRELRDAASKCAEGEQRVKLLKELLKKCVGLKEVEDFVSKERGKFKGGGGV